MELLDGLLIPLSAKRVKREPGDLPQATKPTAVRTALAANVRLYREALGFSQAKLGELCQMTQKRIWEIETQTANSVTLNTISILAEHLGKTEVELLTPTKRG